MKIDSDIDSDLNKFNFDNVADDFDNHIEKSIPLYKNIHQMVSDMSIWFIENNTRIYDVGTSTGTLLEKINESHNNKDIELYGVDTSFNMTTVCNSKFENNKRIKIINNSVLDLEINNASFITMLFTLQFIEPKNRLRVLKNICEGLNSRGAFILVEKIYAEESFINDIWNQLYHDMKLENGLTKEEIFNKDRAIRGVMKPNTNNENLRILKESGFTKIQTFFQWCNFIGYICIKE